MKERTGQVLAVVAGGCVLGVSAFFIAGVGPERVAATSTNTTSTTATPAPGEKGKEPVTSTTTTTIALPTTTTTTLPTRAPDTVPAFTIGQPWGTTVGLTMFRGNPTRSYYGMGPVPESPTVAWRYPDNPMCSSSSEGGESRVWCGMGWTGQPAIWERPDGVTELIFG
ncbi:MAG: hypothetical protein WA726_11395, partial [Acidimicrobiia bacterium]